MSRATTLLLILVAALPGLETSFTNVADPEQAPVVSEHEPFEAEITVRNPYDRAIRITRVESSCDCAELELRDHFLLPFAETTLAMTVVNERGSGLQRQLFRLEVSDPQLEVIDVTVWWHVTPDIAVDTMPEAGPFDRRPESKLRRNVYGFTSHQRPDELARLREIIRLWSPPENAPEGGLQIERIEYAGDLWTFTPRPQDDGSILLVAHARDPEAGYAEGKYEEEVLVHTNHPHKPVIRLLFYCAIDADAGKDGTSDPWAHMR